MCGHLLQGLARNGVELSAILVDAKPELARDTALHFERTGGRMPRLGYEVFEELKIPLYFVRDHNDAAAVSLLLQLRIDLVVNAGTPRILNERFLRAPNVGIVNCHPGLLPQFRGCSAVEWALHLDEPIGNSVHLMAPGIDEGPLLAQQVLTASPAESYQDIRVRVYTEGADLLGRTARAIQLGNLSTESAVRQEAGRYFSPIPDELFQTALCKVQQGHYGPKYEVGHSPLVFDPEVARHCNSRSKSQVQ